MITSYLQGGLGNQLFQVATAISLAKNNSDEAVFSVKNHHLPGQGRKVDNYVNNIFRNIKFVLDTPNLKIYHEPHFHYNKIPYTPNTCLFGYFQSEKYFMEHKEYITDILSPDSTTSAMIDLKYSHLLAEFPVAIHVRRGDYLESKMTHPTPPKEYYINSMNLFEKDTVFLIFSDDIGWCRDTFVGKNVFFIENNPDYMDLYLISMCRGVIMSNSSFSWWGSWLNRTSSKIIISPKTWFGPSVSYNTKDLIPNEWRVL